MTLARLSWTSVAETTPGQGWCELVPASELAPRAERLAEQGYVVVRVDTPRAAPMARAEDDPAEPAQAAAAAELAPIAAGPARATLLRRGRLHAALAGAIDLALARRGAAPRDDDAGAVDPKAQAQEQLLRARDCGATGLCLLLPELRPLADESGALDAADSATLVLWTELSLVWPVVVLVHRSDAELDALVARSLAELVAAAAHTAPRSRCASPATARPLPPVTPRAPAPARSAVPVPNRKTATHTDAGAPSGAEHPCWLEPRALREHAEELTRARGPQPVRVVEQLFRSRYLPLLAALSAGQRHDGAAAALEGWRQDFERTYTDGYTALRVTGRRPAMVLDAPEIATRLARLNGARATELVLVDAMRFDLGERVAARLRHSAGDRAVCVEQMLLWAALPTITPTQLRLLETGARGLREGEPVSEREPTIHRGGSLTTLRRLRLGQRNLLKLDVPEARLREVGPDFDRRMTAIAEEVAETVARFVRSLPPRSLLFLFGDHGFRLQPTDEPASAGPRPTLPAQQGGASPEEVLVPASAWLIGDVH